MSNSIISDIAPFNLYGNIYFVGSSRVSVHFLDTECGLVLIDTGYPDMYDLIIQGIEVLGFDPKNICAIFHSHGHIDHYGCTLRLKELSGAKTYVSRIDNDILNGKKNLSFSDELKIKKEPFDCDVLIEDGDIFTFGKTSVRCRLAPGHTDGSLCFFITVDGSDIVAGMHGGIGTNTLAKDYLIKHNLPFSNRDIFREGLHALAREEKVDLLLGNHPYQSDTVGKLEKVNSGQSVIDSTEWLKLLQEFEGRLDKRIREESK